MRTLIYWFRNDLRLADNPAFTQACLNADHLLPVYVHDSKEQETVYGVIIVITGVEMTGLF